MTTKVDFGNQAEIPLVENGEKATSFHPPLLTLFSKVRRFASDHFIEVVCLACAAATAYLMPITFMVSFSIGLTGFALASKGIDFASDGLERLIANRNSFGNTLKKALSDIEKNMKKDSGEENVEADQDQRRPTLKEIINRMFSANKQFHSTQDKKDMNAQMIFAALTYFFATSRVVPGLFSCLSGLTFSFAVCRKVVQYRNCV